jgi:hypothetical protein
MADGNTTSPEARMDEKDDSASSSNLPSTVLVQDGLPRLTSGPPSRPVTRSTPPSGFWMMPGPAELTAHPLTSGRSTPNVSTIEAVLQAQEEEHNTLQNGQAAVNSSISLLMEFTSRLTNQLSQS